MEQAATRSYVRNVHGVRYQVKDVARSVAFYTDSSGSS
jgi:glyoxylase I family protein